MAKLRRLIDEDGYIIMLEHIHGLTSSDTSVDPLDVRTKYVEHIHTVMPDVDTSSKLALTASSGCSSRARDVGGFLVGLERRMRCESVQDEEPRIKALFNEV